MIYVALAGCTAAAAALVYRYDLYDREPRRLLLLAAALGFAAMPVAGAVESAAIAGLGLHSAGEVALLAGAVEETAKLLAVVGVALLARRHFNDPVDGLVYGSVAGLGMALEEGCWPAGLTSQRLAGHSAEHLHHRSLVSGHSWSAPD